MLSQYWIKKAGLDSVCSSLCSTCALPSPVRVQQVCAVARVWQGSVPLALCPGGWQQVALEGQSSRHQCSDVCRGTHRSWVLCNWHGDEDDGDAAAVTPACTCQLSVFPRVPQSFLLLLAGASQCLTTPPVLLLNLPAEFLLLQEGQCIIEHISGMLAFPDLLPLLNPKPFILAISSILTCVS